MPIVIISAPAPALIESAPAVPVMESFPEFPFKMNDPAPVADDKSNVLTPPAFRLNVAVPALLVPLVAVKPIISVAFRIATLAITTISLSVPLSPPKSVIVSYAASMLNVSFPEPPSRLSRPEPPVIISLPAPPVIMSLPAPPTIVSTSPPPAIVSTPSPPVIISTPSPPVIAKASVWFAKVTSDPEECVLTVSTFCSLLLSAKA